MTKMNLGGNARVRVNNQLINKTTMKELLYTVECTTDGGNTWTAICVDAVTAINVNAFVIRFLPDYQTSIRIAECDCASCKVSDYVEASLWILSTLGIKAFFTISGEENIFHFSSIEHAEEINAMFREHGQDSCDVILFRY